MEGLIYSKTREVDDNIILISYAERSWALGGHELFPNTQVVNNGAMLSVQGLHHRPVHALGWLLIWIQGLHQQSDLNMSILSKELEAAYVALCKAIVETEPHLIVRMHIFTYTSC